MQKLGKTSPKILVSVISAIVLLLCITISALTWAYSKIPTTQTASAAGTPFYVTVTDYSDGEYLGADGSTSYGSAYPTAKSYVIVKISTMSGSLVTTQKISFLTQDGQAIDMGGSLTANTQYRVQILAPTYLRFSVKHYVDATNYNSFTANTFIITHTGSQKIEVVVDGVQDDSWLTYFS